MASASDASPSKSYEITTVEATGLTPVRFRLGRSFSTHVQIDAGNLSWTTPGVHWKNNGNIRWNDKIVLPPLARTTKVTFSLFRDKTLIGRTEINLTEGLAKSELHFNEDAVLSLQCEDKETGKLTVRVTEGSNTALSNAVNRLGVTTNLTAPAPTAAADIASAPGDAVTSVVQPDLVGSLTLLFNSLNFLIKVGDEIAKIHPWLNLAWNVVSVGLKLVKAQQDRNEQIAALIQTIQSMYLIVVGAENLADERIQDVLERVLKQTVICAFFVQEYARRGSSGGKSLAEFLSSTDALVTGYQATFAQLRDEFTGRIATQTALNIDNIAATVNEIRFDQLTEKLRPAVMDQSKRDVCLPKTRQDVIKLIMDWYSDGSEGRESAMWLYGLAGTGKSTLSNTIARMMGRADGVNLLGAFFFFDRSVPEANASTVIRTIAYQLAQFDPSIGAKIEQIIKAFPDIASQPLAVQFSKLLSIKALGDVPWSRGPVLVIIEALDECGSEAERQGIMRALSEGVSQLPPFLRLLIVSRHERDILEQFKHSTIRHQELRIDTKTGQEDINAFIRSRLHEIREANIDYIPQTLKDWPDDDEVESLGGLASGHFIWAATACRLIAASRDPKKRMRELLEHQRQRIPLVIDWSNTGPIRILHASFHDYLTIHDRAAPWAIGVEQCKVQLASGCIALLEQELRENICNLVLPLPGPETPSLSESISYASKFWVEHVCSITNVPGDLAEVIYHFLQNHLLHWMEVLAIMKAHGVAIHSLSRLLQWTQKHSAKSELYHFVHDAHRFAQYFSSTIEKHPLLIYTSAIPFTPHDTLIFENFHDKQLPYVVSDLNSTWPPLLQVLYGHEGWVWSVCFSPDGSKIVSGSEDGTIRVWDAVTGQPATRPLQGYNDNDPVPSVCFSPDGSKIVSGSYDNTVRVYDAVTGQPAMPPLRGHEKAVGSVCFSPDGSKIASGSDDHTIRLWNAVTGQSEMPPIQGHKNSVLTVCFSPDASKIASGALDGTVRVWDAVTGQPTMPPLECVGRSVCFSPDGSKIASGSDDGTVRVWDAVTGQLAMTLDQGLKGREGRVWSICFSPDGSKVASGMNDYTIRVWDVVTGQLAMPLLRGHKYAVYTVCFSPDGSKIASGSEDRTIRLWDVVTQPATMSLSQGHQWQVTCASFSRDRSKIVSGSRDGTLGMWDAFTGQAVFPLIQAPIQTPEAKKTVNSVCFSPDGSKFASGSDEGTVGVWDAITGQAAFLLIKGHHESTDDAVYVVVFSSDGSKIISGSKHSIRVWDTITGQAARPALPALRASHNHVSAITHLSLIVAEINSDGCKSVSVPDFSATKSLAGETCDTVAHMDRTKAPVILSLDTDGYFVDVQSGRHLGKLPDGFTISSPKCHQYSCIGWTRSPSGLYIPVIIHFPS